MQFVSYLRCATEGARAIAVADALLAQAEVGHLHIAVLVEEQVVQLNVQRLRKEICTELQCLQGLRTRRQRLHYVHLYTVCTLIYVHVYLTSTLLILFVRGLTFCNWLEFINL